MQPPEGSRGCADAIKFVPVADEHLTMIAAWLAEPHVRAWWGEPDVELELIRNGRDSGEADGYVCIVGGQPAGYVQSWEPHQFIGHEPWIEELPPGTVGVDVFIGPRGLVGKGIGPKIIAAFVGRLHGQGIGTIVIDPDVKNGRAIRAYSKAGFIRDRLVASSDGRFDTLLMTYRPSTEGNE